MLKFIARLFARPATTRSRSVRLSADALEARDTPAFLGSASFDWVMIQPQPLPPGQWAMIQPQPLPPGVTSGIVIGSAPAVAAQYDVSLVLG